jgi:hypothetical protein
MASLSPAPKLQFFSAAGVPLVGGKVYSYEAGTTTPLATYTSSAGNVENANPVILNSRGEGEIWLAQNSYKLVLKDSNDVEIWTVDNIAGAASQADLQALISSLSATSGASEIGFIQDYADAVARTVENKLREWVSVLDFGADPTGTTDSRAAIQLALDSGAKCVIFPEGTYLINSLSPDSPVPVVGYDNLNCFCLYINENIDIELLGFGATLKRTNSPINCSKYILFNVISDGIFKMDGFHVETPLGTPGAGNTPGTIIGHFENCNGLTLSNLTTVTTGGFEIFSCKNVVVDTVQLSEGIDHISFDTTSGVYSENITITNCQFYDVQFDSIDLNNAVKDFVIEGNVFVNANVVNLETEDRNEFIDIGGATYPIKNGVIANNVMIEEKGFGNRFIYVKQQTESLIIANNVMVWGQTRYTTVEGIKLNFSGSNIKISNNFIDNVDIGMNFENAVGANLIISDNTFKNFTQYGLNLEIGDAVITGNKFLVTDSSITSNLYGMRIDSAVSANVTNNVIDLYNSASSMGIRFTASNTGSPSNVSGNIVKNCGIGIVHNLGNANYTGNVISDCYGSAFSAVNSGKNITFNCNHMTDNFRNGQNVVIQSITCNATVQFLAVSNIVCNSNFIGEAARNTEIGLIKFDPTDAAANSSLMAVGNMISADCSVRQIDYTAGYANQVTANNLPTAA